jgi:hypothetical protein
VTDSRRHDADLAKRDFQRILLVKPSSLGDVIQVTGSVVP